MAASSSKSFQSQVQDDLLQCPICCSIFVNPRVLKCQHTFCYRCLQGCLKNSKGTKNLKCAVCRKDTPLTKNGLADIPKNLVVVELMQIVKKSGTSSASCANKAKATEQPKTTSLKTGTKRVAVKATSDKNKNYGSKKKQDATPDKEYRIIYRREYTPTDGSDSESENSSDSHDSSSDSYTSSDDHCCCCGCDCCDYSSYDDSNDCTSCEDSSESSDCCPLTSKMKNMGVRQKRGCPQRSTACVRESNSNRSRSKQSRSVRGCCSEATTSKTSHRRNRRLR